MIGPPDNPVKEIYTIDFTLAEINALSGCLSTLRARLAEDPKYQDLFEMAGELHSKILKEMFPNEFNSDQCGTLVELLRKMPAHTDEDYQKLGELFDEDE